MTREWTNLQVLECEAGDGAPVTIFKQSDGMECRYVLGNSRPVAPNADGSFTIRDTADVLNVMFLGGAWRLWRRNDAMAEADRYRAEKRFFGFSILYLFLHFVLILIETGLRAVDLTPAHWPMLS